ncbi:MAG: reverse transcriptase domain-containing protein [Kangiellaceae bacterium]|nr:reverse transcriptase domain-containing protein [Kangiellaceae bacterium]
MDREVLWDLFRHYGIPPPYINLIQQLYENAQCQVIHNGKLTDPFDVKTGVRQGCLLSPMIFLMVVDWIMRETTKSEKTGIQWTLTQCLEDLDFADDLCLMSQKHQHMQSKSNKLKEEAAKTRLRINIGKTETMRTNNKQETPITLGVEALKTVDKFAYLGSIVSTTGGSDEDIKARLGKARQAFNTLKTVWKSPTLSTRNKLRLFNSNVKSVLLYGSETWRMNNVTNQKLQVFINRCLRNILQIRYPETISNRDLWQRTQQDPIGQQIARRKWRWIGHTLRKPAGNIARQALEWNPQGKRKVGRPRKTWRRSCDEELKMAGITWGSAKKTAQSRVRWRVTVEALCSTRNPQD